MNEGASKNPFKETVAKEVFNSSTEAIMVTNQLNKIVYVNPAFSQMTGYSSAEAIGKNPSFLKSGEHNRSFYHELWHSLTNKKSWEGSIWDKHKLGHRISRKVRISSVRDIESEEEFYVAIYSENKQKSNYHNILEKLAYYDSLTNFPNRALLLELLEEKIKRAEINSEDFYIGFVDIDNFKSINDIHGHIFGDKIIKEVIKVIDDNVSENDIVGRMSGDEFLIIFEESQSAEKIQEKVNSVFDSITQPIHIDNEFYFIYLSVGVCHYPKHATDIQSLISRADIAMYEAKKQVGSKIKWFTRQIGKEFLETSGLEREAIKAVKSNEIFPHFQPQICCKSGKVVGIEALARWKNKDGKFVPPNKFIPLIEDSAHISEMFWNFLKKCLDQVTAIGPDFQPLLSLNVSVNQLLEDSFSTKFLSFIDDAEFPASRIELEITESKLIERFDIIVPCLEALKKGGVSLALDDFGSGFSSLTYLKYLPINKLKFDKMFVGQILSPVDQTIFSSMINMAHKLNLTVVAEGVENSEQREVLTRFGCDILQGFFIQRPAPLNDVKF